MKTNRVSKIVLVIAIMVAMVCAFNVSIVRADDTATNQQKVDDFINSFGSFERNTYKELSENLNVPEDWIDEVEQEIKEKANNAGIEANCRDYGAGWDALSIEADFYVDFAIDGTTYATKHVLLKDRYKITVPANVKDTDQAISNYVLEKIKAKFYWTAGVTKVSDNTYNVSFAENGQDWSDTILVTKIPYDASTATEDEETTDSSNTSASTTKSSSSNANATLDNEPKTGTTNYVAIASVISLLALAGIVTLKFKKK